jgi:hypothetical protein
MRVDVDLATPPVVALVNRLRQFPRETICQTPAVRFCALLKASSISWLKLQNFRNAAPAAAGCESSYRDPEGEGSTGCGHTA